MPRYEYDAVYPNGEQVSGVVEAVSEQAAVAQIRQTCDVVLRLSEIRSPASDPLTRFRRTSAKSLALVCQQFSIILKAGLPLVQAVDLVAGQCPDKMLRQLLHQVSEDGASGWSMSYSLDQRGGGKLPVFGRIGLMAGASQFAHTMSTMMAAGMPILQALDISGRAVSNQKFAQSILSIIPGVEAGHGMGACMEGDPVLPDMLVQMTAVGEATGSLESTLDILAEYYDNEVDTATARAMSLLEPIIIVFLGLTVAFVLFSVYLPLFTMEQSI